MTPVEFTALLALSTATSFSPGPNTTLSTALAANLGFSRSLRFIVAVPVGWGLLFSICAGGVGALVVALPPLRIAIQALGVAYMLWLSRKIWRSSTLTQANAAQINITFWQGVMMQFLNIKAWMLALAVVAGWVAGQTDAWARFAIILPVMLAFGFFSNLSYALIGSLLRSWLEDPEHGGRRLRWFNRIMATVLVVTAAWMATF